MAVSRDGKIWWVDSLRWNPFGDETNYVVIVLKRIMEKVLPSTEWTIQLKDDNKESTTINYLSDVLGYQTQANSYSYGS